MQFHHQPHWPWRSASLFLLFCLFTGLLGAQPAQAQSPLPPKPQTGLGDSLHFLPEALRSSLPQEPPPAPELPADLPVQNQTATPWAYTVYQSFTNESWNLFLIDGVSPTPRQISNSGGDELGPRINTRATQVVFYSVNRGASDIYVVNADGSRMNRLTSTTENETFPAWSPDGAHIAYARGTDHGWQIFVMDNVGNGAIELTGGLGGENSFPDWSPDGSQIAWVRKDPSSNAGQLWVMNADGSNPHAISDSCDYMQHPRWSPEGKRIALDCDIDGDIWNESVLLDLEGGPGLQVLGNMPDPLAEIWVSGWYGPSSVLYTVLRYVSYQNQLYLDTVVMGGNGRYNFYGASNNGRDMAPSFTSLDTQPPFIQLNPLPTYTPAPLVRLVWDVWDQGPAGLFEHEVQYHIGEGTSYGDFVLHLNDLFRAWEWYGEAGNKVFFRIRAVDNLGQASEWAELSTTLYSYHLKGQVLDPRGFPLQRVPVSIQPQPIYTANTGWSGTYHTMLLAAGKHNLSTSVPGYAPGAALWSANRDGQADIHLQPENNLLVNGDFETAGLQGWQSNGDLPVVAATAKGVNASTAARFGLTCAFPCMGEAQVISNSPGAQPAIVVDSQGLAHVVVRDGRGVYYSARAADGQWQAKEYLPGSNSSSTNLDLATGRDDRLYALWEAHDADGAGLYLSERPANGNWQPAQRIGAGSEPYFGVDDFGRVHVAYQGVRPDGTEYYGYIRRDPQGVWGEERMADPGADCNFSNIMAVTPDGMAHFLYYEMDPNVWNGTLLMYRQIQPDGTCSVYRNVVDYNTSPGPVSLNMGLDGRIYVMTSYLLFTGTPSGGFQEHERDLRSPLTNTRLWIDKRGLQFAVIEGGKLGTQVPDKEWVVTPLKADEACVYGGLFDGWLDANNIFHLALMCNGKPVYFTWDEAEQAQQASLSQVVSVPVDLQSPTLSFAYWLFAEKPARTSLIKAEVRDAEGENEELSFSMTPTWQYGWIDLSRWAGETVTVTFTTEQAVGDPFVRGHIDQVGVGAWLTPVIEGVQPSDDVPGKPMTVTVIGQNFMSGAQVFLGSLDGESLANIQQPDSSTLVLTFTDGLQAGVYTIWVANPGGPATGGRFLVGLPTYIPLLSR